MKQFKQNKSAATTDRYLCYYVT